MAPEPFFTVVAMEPARTLRDVFAGMAGHTAGHEDAGQATSDPRTFLAEHENLPDHLLVTAIGSYAGTAPAEVAEHLAPIVAANEADISHGGETVTGADAMGGLNLLASAPVGAWEGEVSLDPTDHVDPSTDHLDTADHLDGSDQDFHLSHLGAADSLDHVDHLDHFDQASDVDHQHLAGMPDAAGQEDLFEHAADNLHTIDNADTAEHPTDNDTAAGHDAGQDTVDDHLGHVPVDGLDADALTEVHPSEEGGTEYETGHHEDALADHDGLPEHDGLDDFHH
jgi:hypothetical protein